MLGDEVGQGLHALHHVVQRLLVKHEQHRRVDLRPVRCSLEVVAIFRTDLDAERAAEDLLLLGCMVTCERFVA